MAPCGGVYSVYRLSAVSAPLASPPRSAGADFADVLDGHVIDLAVLVRNRFEPPICIMSASYR